MADEKKEKISTDEEIRKLVIARLKLLSPDTLKSIGSKGTFTRDELIERVEKGDEVGKIVTNIEMEWLRALKSGIVRRLYE
jgi:hypothetical protein